MEYRYIFLIIIISIQEVFYPKESNLAGQLLVNQVQHYTEYDKRLLIAKKFIQAAADNIYRNLRYYNGRDKMYQII